MCAFYKLATIKHNITIRISKDSIVSIPFLLNSVDPFISLVHIFYTNSVYQRSSPV